jgi:hypothetical protein
MCQKDGRWGSWTNGAALWERSRLEQVRGSIPRAHLAAGFFQGHSWHDKREQIHLDQI